MAAEQGSECRVALVTGSTSGIGKGIAEILASSGYDVILTGLLTDDIYDDIEDFSGELRSKYKVYVKVIEADLSRSNSLERMCDKVKDLYPKGIDILVNNAGIQFVSNIEDFPDEKWDQIISIMLTAPFRLIKEFLPAMKTKGWGRIVNIASVHGLVASPKKAAYVSAKHGLLGLTKVVALETAGSGVTCNAICPGFVDTEIFQGQVKKKSEEENCTHKKAEEMILQQVHPTMKPVEVKQVAEFVRFVCSDACDQMTGSTLTMDAGWTAR